ncbi:hypothetical protein DH2020_035233 [Rehmannia glutinosa]|uniref:Exocyst complex component SEC5 n=1 Tax=Rehmannia glutinosa TaxID=99300 RepID=A0ABR0VAF5_REHGL
MSSDGDDLDEDELLQIALKEQAQRDLNYHKPSQATSKPVRNYVQPPSNRGPSASGRNLNAAPPQQQKGINQQRKPSLDEDEDSEVELLSISSGDEDDRGGVVPRNRVGSGRGMTKRGMERSLTAGSALMKLRVREMRDSKAVPVAQKIERKPKGLTSVQSLPRGMEWVDPLGLGLINHKTFRLISDNVANAPSSIDVEPLDPNARAQAEKIRSVQGMLQRFRTLFNLPSAIRGNISKGEYDLAVREYRKAKSIVLPSHVGILKRVLEEVEKVMQEFKGMLYKAMEDPNIDLTNLENTVRLLLELEPESDPIKHYLNIQNRKIRGLLEKCTLDHEARMENLQNELREKALSDAKWRQIQQDINQSAGVDYSLSAVNSHLAGDLFPAAETSIEELDALRGRYIRQLTASSSTDPSTNSSMNKAEDKVGDLDEVAGMIRNTLSAYESKVLSTFRDLEESNILSPYMNDAIKEISRASQAFEAKESAPPIAVSALRTLEFEISKIYILRLCSWMRSSIEEISKDESWVPVSILERNKSPYSISSLPLVFRAVMISAMDQINEMLHSLQSESARSEDVYAQLQDIQESVRLAFFNCLLDFAGMKDVEEKVEDDGDMQDLVTSFSGLEDKVIAQYTVAKTNLIRSAAVNYLLDAGVQWGAAPAVKGVRDAAVDLLHTLVAVHAEESLKSLQGSYWKSDRNRDRVCRDAKSSAPRPTRGSDDVLADDRLSGSTASPDDLIALAQQYSSELLQAELERTRINTACFVETLPLDSVQSQQK